MEAAHAFAGTAAALGGRRVRAAAIDLEKAAGEHDWLAVTVCLATLRDETERLRQALAELSSSPA